MLRVFDPVGSQPISRWRWTGCGLPHKGTASAPQTWVLSGLNTWPARAPTNASLQPHGWPRIARGRHGSLLLCRTTLAFATPRRLSRRYPLYPPGGPWVITCFGNTLSGGSAPRPPGLFGAGHTPQDGDWYWVGGGSKGLAMPVGQSHRGGAEGTEFPLRSARQSQCAQGLRRGRGAKPLRCEAACQMNEKSQMLALCQMKEKPRP